MGDKANKQTSDAWNPLMGLVGGVVALTFMGLGGCAGLEKLYDQHTSHEKLSSLRYHGEWTNGEYRECSSTNVKEEDKEPVMECEGAAFSDQYKVFQVEFSGGLTYDNEVPKGQPLLWTCRRTGGDSTFSCHMKPEPTSQRSREGGTTPLAEGTLSESEVENLRKRNACEQRFYDKKIADVDGMSPGAACKRDPDRQP
jgi:hypothetical protein